MDCFYEEEGNKLCLSKDEVDIVREHEIHDGEGDEHVGSLGLQY